MPITPVPTAATRRVGLSNNVARPPYSANFAVRNAGQVSLRDKQDLRARSIEVGRKDVASKVGDKHSVALQVQGDADAFHQVREDDLGSGAAALNIRIHRCAIHSITERWIASVGPINDDC